LPMLLNLGISGYSNIGDDIGGFWGSPLPDVLTRWHQIGAFNPIFRNHTEKGSADQEPWVHGPQHEAIRKRYIEARYRLMPYIYTATEENTQTGVPLMRAMFLEFPDAGDNGEQFMFGSDLLVAPAVWEMLPEIEIELPPGLWYDYWTGKPQAGGKNIKVKSRIEEMPVFARAGAIIPQMSLVQSMDEVPKGPLELHVYLPQPGGECRGNLYQDDGLSFAFREGAVLRMSFGCKNTDSGTTFSSTRQGSFQPWWSEVQFIVHGAKAGQVTAGASPMPSTFDAGRGILTFTVPAASLAQEIKVSY
jgi:alpha-glucosidase